MTLSTRTPYGMPPIVATVFDALSIGTIVVSSSLPAAVLLCVANGGEFFTSDTYVMHPLIFE